MSRPHDISRASKAVHWLITEQGYRVGIAWDEEREDWLATAKHDAEDRFYSARSPTEERTVAMLAEAVGVELDDG